MTISLEKTIMNIQQTKDNLQSAVEKSKEIFQDIGINAGSGEQLGDRAEITERTIEDKTKESIYEAKEKMEKKLFTEMEIEKQKMNESLWGRTKDYAGSAVNDLSEKAKGMISIFKDYFHSKDKNADAGTSIKEKLE